MNKTVRLFRLFFGLFMVVVYLGMAYMMIVNLFGWDETLQWNIIRWGMAVIFGAYGIYRLYRQLKGTDYYRSRDLESRYDKYTSTENDEK